ncbi:FKBP-type peptidyl-prolyl cis-trans isomerase [Cytophaga sp. FL35]|uniref:FKBP-type peptidyl-prolyl cis-trans isomerase n=1 Tax=Cytophaga sp. FL35 TaxID=1904456 RepID=UPI001653CE2E|nr:FKBP-type peptidyl-prolyl cis-trans isomerase [Cytophaga sp. FL35]MBC6997448.1 FKBP-type peptidyl-prolyl cis-trans isomerase [Cytophaga sp. FL35]
MKYLLLPLIFLSLVSCLDDNGSNEQPEPIDYTAQNDEDIQIYLEQNELTAVKTDTGLYYIINEQGDGAQPTSSSDVTVAYKGYFLNGSVFDQSSESGITFNLQQVIPGWTEGITYFNEGGSGMLLIPSHLGYGSFDYNGIPGGSVLIFDINLISVN